MPKIKTKRDDILRQKEILDTIRKAEDKLWLQCLIALAWIFGKRINELLKVQKDDIRVNGEYLYVRFLVSKKKLEGSQQIMGENGKLHRKLKLKPIPERYVKRINLKHPGIPYILAHLNQVKDGMLFIPHLTNAESRRVQATRFLKQINSNVWWHLFRHSLATEMAERGKSEFQLESWFDWDDPRTARKYVRRGTKLTEELSDRTW